MYTSVQSTDSGQLEQHIPLVKRIACHLISKLPDSVQIDDLIQSGMLGLLEAVKNFDSSKGASFATYAGIRIRGSMLDEVRRSDWTPRSVHKNARRVAEAIQILENQTGGSASDGDVAKFMGLDLDEYHRILHDSISSKTFSIEELMQTAEYSVDKPLLSEQPEDALSRDDFRKALATAIAELPEKERLVVSLYYDDELNLREIGEVLGVGESRVCQISSQATLRLRARLKDWLHGDSDR